MATIADLVNAFDGARTPLVQALRQSGPVQMNGPNGTTHVFVYAPANPLEMDVLVAKPASGITVNVAPPIGSTVPVPTPNTAPPAVAG